MLDYLDSVRPACPEWREREFADQWATFVVVGSAYWEDLQEWIGEADATVGAKALEREQTIRIQCLREARDACPRAVYPQCGLIDSILEGL
ncbi:MAG: hypothetical protein OXC99_06290 [Chloroflexi bacterium]|nr:hypothetical protein [Chloroflexota bacterium]